ncbi:MAG: hypothetical protein K2L82_14140 [Lachnospiraceae bacterium]|nr:hypothetical protein [Lachnospiraceae bacterium]
MMRSEFIERTGFEPTAKEYEKIEAAYYEYEGDKDAFCKKFKKEDMQRYIRERAIRIDELEREIEKKVREQELNKKTYEEEINKLHNELDRELDWKQTDSTGTQFSPSRYNELSKSTGTRVLSEKEAKELIYEEFGFAPEKVKIIQRAETYEVNKYRLLRVSGRYERSPLYNSTDWNYIRFDCTGWQYEMVNGQLYEYNS